ncbi:MAG: 2-dehydropantoate 2-reductase N-terminal domain-containing protein [Thermoflexales bacterium]
MRALIIGVGPVGLWLGANLLRAGHDVGLVGRPRVTDALRSAGLAVETPTGNWRVATPAVFDSISAAPQFGPCDLICITTKAYDLAGALDEIAAARLISAGSDTVLAAFQNGVGAEEMVADHFGVSRTIAATTTTPVSLAGPGRLRVERAGGGIAWGPLDAIAPGPRERIAALVASGCGTHIADGRSLKWSKLLLNLSGNASGAILDLPPERLYADGRMFGFEMEMLREAVRVMHAAHIPAVSLPGAPAASLAWALRWLPDFALRLVLRRRLSAARGDKRPSLYYELANHTGRSEVAWLNGAVVEAGHRLGVQTPVNARLAEVMTALVSGSSAWSEWRGSIDTLLRLA